MYLVEDQEENQEEAEEEANEGEMLVLRSALSGQKELKKSKEKTYFILGAWFKRMFALWL